jgi:regulator of sigma E protease
MLSGIANLPIVELLTAIVSFIVALGILITGHEFGHFWVARRCGVKVLRFSIGFGKRLYGWTDKHGTEFVIAAIPLGGYVKMLDERAEEVEPALRQQAFNNKSVGQRAAIIAAGPIANFLLALLFCWLINIIGQSVLRPVVGSVIPESIVAQAGIMPEEELKSIAGIETKSWYDVGLALISAEGKSDVGFEVSPLGSEQREIKTVDLSGWRLSPNENPIAAIGVIPVIGDFKLKIDAVVPNSAAEVAGIRQGDRILSVNGKELATPSEFNRLIQNNPDVELQLGVERDGEHRQITLKPQRKVLKSGKEQGSAGVVLLIETERPSEKYIATVQYGPIEAIYYAGKQVEQMTTVIAKEVVRLVSGQRELSSLAGPITMAKGAGKSAENGLISYLGFLAIISLNLGMINLFPLPVLDGGHLLFLAIEKITGRPISERVQDYCYRVGVTILIMLMGLAFFNDFSHPLG